MFIRATNILMMAALAALLSCSKEKASHQSASSSKTSALTGYSSGVSTGDTTVAGRYFSKADRYFNEAHYDSAILYLEKARTRFTANEEWAKVVRAYNKIGASYTEKGEYSEALVQLHHALKLGQNKLGMRHAAVAETFNNLGYTNWRQAQYDSALAHHKKALSIRLSIFNERHPQVAQSYHNLALVYQSQGDIDRAIAFHDLALSIRKATLGKQHADVAETYNSRAGDYFFKGDYDKALDDCYEALAIWSNTLGEQHPKTAFSYGNIAILYSMKGDLEQALEFFNKQLPIQIATQGENHPQVANIYANIGLAYDYLGNYEKALSYTEKGIAGMEAALGEHHPEVANNYNNKGKILRRLGRYQQALKAHDKAISILLSNVGEKHPWVAQCYNNIGEAHAGKGDYDAALKAYNQALSVMHTLYGAHHPELAEVYNNLGNVYLRLGAYDQALEAFQRAFNANIPTLIDDDPTSNPPLINALSENNLLLSLGGKAQVLAERFAHQSGDQQDVKLCLTTYQHAARLIDKMRSGYKAQESKLFMSEQATGIYDHAIAAARRLYAITPQDEYQAAAFSFAEKSKTGIMLEALSEAEARQYAGIPDSLLAKEHQLRIDLAFYDRNLAETSLNPKAADSAQTALWRDKSFRLRQTYDRLLERLEREYPDYYNLKYQHNTVAVERVRKDILDENTALVEYFTGKDSIFIFTISADDFNVASVVKDSSFAQQIKQLREGILKRDYVLYSQAGYFLYQILLEPVVDRLNAQNLIIVPDGVITAIPFEAMLTNAVSTEDKSQEFSRLPYVVNKYTISYAYSATLLLETLKRRRTQPKRDYLAFAPVFSVDTPAGTRGHDLFNNNLMPDSARAVIRINGYLPASRKEVTDIQKVFENSYGFWERMFSGKAQVFLEREASEAHLKLPELGNYRYLHFATHGFVNEVTPKLSGLVLAKDAASTEDGILYLGEIYNLDLNADLVVLSACETGLGQIAKGEGIIGLTRGFLYAGAANILVSLWQVNDETTADLMVDFYGSMLKGQTKAEALRQAKLNLIQSHPEYAKPYYWAPFVLIGK